MNTKQKSTKTPEYELEQLRKEHERLKEAYQRLQFAYNLKNTKIQEYANS